MVKIKTNDEHYGISPMVAALPLIRAYNALSQAERAKAATQWVEEQIAWNKRQPVIGYQGVKKPLKW
jgi:hypothetical protein